MSSSRSFSFKECSTTGHVHGLDLENKFSTTKTSQHEPLTVLCKLFNLCSLDGDTSTIQQGPLHPGPLGGLHGQHSINSQQAHFVQSIQKYYRKRHKVKKNPIGGKFIIQDGRQNTFAIYAG